MISFTNIPSTKPYSLFKKKYNEAVKKKQNNIEAIAISSFNKKENEVESRFVNLKYIHKTEWIFFTNLNSPKSEHFKSHNQVSALFFWDSINVQIRIKGKIAIYDKKLVDEHFNKRDIKKNAVAVFSEQSKKIKSYEEVIKRYSDAMKNKKLFKKRPEHWGAYSFNPYYFEFWEGHNSRINKREVFELKENHWINYNIQP